MRSSGNKKVVIRHLARLPAAMALFGVVAAQVQAEDAVLDTVQVTGEVVRDPQGTAHTYSAPTVSVGRSKEAPRDVPQSVTSITQQLMQDQDANTLKDALRNAVGVTFNAAEGGASGDGVRLRGFNTSNDLYLDNFRDAAQYNRDTFNLDRVEVLRGSASMLYGRGSTGGVINQVSKTPFFSNWHEISATLGTDDYYRIEADLNRKLSENVAARLNIMGQEAGSFREGAEMNRWGVAPSLAIKAGEKARINLSYLHYEEDNVPDYGVPYYEDKPLGPANRFYGLNKFDYEKTKSDVFTADISYDIAPGVLLRNMTRYGEYELDLSSSAPRLNLDSTGGVLTDATEIKRNRKLRMRDQDILANITELSGSIDTGAVRHQLLAGMEVSRESLLTTARKSDCELPSATYGNPDPFQSYSCDAVHVSGYSDLSADTLAFYAQDTIQLSPVFKVILGARWDKLSIEFDQQPEATARDRKDKVWSYRAGFLYQPDAVQSYYASYGTSFNPSAEAYSLDARGTNTPPEKNRNFEIGAKWDLLDGDLALRTAIFRSEKTNERVTDIEPGGEPQPYLLSGKRHTDGIELEAAGRLTRQWQLFGGVALMDPVLDKVGPQDDPQWEGNMPDNAPKYTGNLWTTYQVDSNWKIGGGFTAVGKRYTSKENLTYLPSYVRTDLMAEWTHRDVSLQLNIYNLFDQDHYEGLYRGFAVPGTGRSARLTAKYSF
ncbi:TonB-dependent receptor [Chitinilyticum piscinae]|uniref:TonB-dependent siderophore receptor n=1 Tax=Chitinilyticum piscinae TaxID=2866724 RepID=A0A8J7FLH9_9NEIS|nr:TonB-dependent siderophore receptor [Chitinilyticum piscinae]MBE9610062.1 TonB-dependent siderophore receptor [Chitinilyticum piscinae]